MSPAEWPMSLEKNAFEIFSSAYILWRCALSLRWVENVELASGSRDLIENSKDVGRVDSTSSQQSKEPNASERTTEHGLYSSKVQQKAAMVRIARKKRSVETSKTSFFQPDRPSYAVPLADDMNEI
ncbi:hypothetical protein PV326_008478 [Microctonus aethiopoides]|nr:hypothetical protein PV326_008478 [Microctonus aethiopoides]